MNNAKDELIVRQTKLIEALENRLIRLDEENQALRELNNDLLKLVPEPTYTQTEFAFMGYDESGYYTTM